MKSIEKPIVGFPQKKEDIIKKIEKEFFEFKKSVDNKFEKEDSDKINKALDLMFDLHYDQKDRPDGKPYISHPLEVADDILNKYEVTDKDLVISALMHDSVEDQSEKLAKMKVERDAGAILDSEEKIKEEALNEINYQFGEKVKNVVGSLSNPDFDSKINELSEQGIEKDKAELYKEHVKEAIKSSDVFVIKYADFARNALKIQNVPEGPRKDKLRKKYGPVIKEVFLPAFENMDESNPLYKKRLEIIEDLNNVLEEQY